MKDFSKYYLLKRFYGKIFLFLNFLAAIAIGLSYLSIYISPQKIWFLAFFGLAYPYILLINFFFILIWILSRKLWFLVSVVFILTGCNHFNDFFQINFKSDKIVADSSSTKILSYNVRLFDLYNWGKNWTYNKKNRNKIIQFLKKEQADIICFQEYFSDTSGDFMSGDTLAKYIKAKNYHDYFTAHNRNHYFGIATFSVYPIVGKGNIKFEKSNNTCIYTDLKIKNDTVRVFNCHLESVHFHTSDYNFVDSILNPEKERIKSSRKILSKLKSAFLKRASQVKTISEAINKSPYPVFVCGDFNDTPISFAYHKMRGNLNDAFEESGNGLGNTYSGLLSVYRIDYILHSNTIETYGYQTHKIEYSDHFPIECFWRIKSAN